MIATKNSLPEKIRGQVIELLQKTLSDSIDLTTQAKQAHWNVKGHSFIALHELFDQIAEESETYTDLVAERIVQLGGIAEGTLEIAARRSSLPKYPLKVLTDQDHVSAFSHTLATYSELVRKQVEKVTEVHDPATADLFTEILRGVDKNLWFVEAHHQLDRRKD